MFGEKKMKKLILLVFLFIQCNFITIFAQKYYKGIVIDTLKNKAIPNAKITAKLSNKVSITTTTDKSGFFKVPFDSLEFDNSKGQIKITKKGYQDLIREILIQSNRIDTFRLESLDYIFPNIIITAEKNPNYIEELHKFNYQIESKELQKSVSSTLGLTLKNEVDFFVRSMGPATSKPVFRGLGLDYLKVFENDVPVKDLSSTAPDHSTAIDPTIFDKIEVIRGPKLLVYSPNAIGGIVNLSSKDFLVEKVDKISLTGKGIYESGTNSKILTILVEVPFNDFFVSGSYNYKKALDMVSGKGVIPNTYFNSNSGNIFTGGQISNFSAYLGLGMYKLNYGVPGGFVGAHPKGVDISLERNNQMFRALYHFHTILDNVTISFNRTYYHHTEYEKTGSVGAEFLLKDYYANVNFNFQSQKPFNETILGLNFQKSNNQYGGYVFTPNTYSWLFSTYLYQSIKIGNHLIDYSVRFDHKEYDPMNENKYTKNPPKNRNFNAYSFSVLVMHYLNDIASVGLNLGRSERIPNIEELYSNGPHLAAYSYEIGNTDLNKELGYFAELSFNLLFKNSNFNFAIFDYEFQKFLFPQNTGTINVSQLLPIYKISDTKARIFGFSTNCSYEILPNFVAKFNTSFSKGINLTENSNLPQIPPLKGQFKLEYQFQKVQVSIFTDFALRQNLTGPFEEPTPGYAILNSNVRFWFPISKLTGVVNLSVENIFNKLYFNHLSRIKSVYPEIGRNITIHFLLYF